MVLILYVAGTFTTYWLEHRIGMGGEHPLEDAFLVAGFGAFAVVGALSPDSCSLSWSSLCLPPWGSRC
jgi:hypothetical protein